MFGNFFLYNQQLYTQTVLNRNSYLEEQLRNHEKTIRNLERSLTKLKNTVDSQKEQLKLRTIAPTSGTPFKALSRNGRWHRKKQITQVLEKVFETVGEDVERVNVTLNIQDYGELEIVCRGEEGVDATDNTDQNKKIQQAARILKAKDGHRISWAALQALRREAKLEGLLSKYFLQQEALRLATCLQLMPIPGVPSKDVCSRQLLQVVEHILDLPQNRFLMETEESTVTLCLRFACDGAKITKTKGAVRGVCKVIPSQSDLRFSRNDSPEDEFTLFLFMGDEDRETLKLASERIRLQMRQSSTEGFLVKGKTVRVKWIISSDWKALCLLKGVNSANSHHFCLWCHCDKNDIAQFDKSWEVERNTLKQRECLDGTTTPNLGYVHEDLLPWIPYHNIVPDELHLRMRITSKLLNQVVAWTVDQGSKQALLDEMARLKVPFHFFEEQGDDGRGQIKKWTQLSGDHLETVLRGLDILKILDGGPRDLRNLCLLSKDTLKRLLEKKLGHAVPAAMKKSTLVAELELQTTAEEQRKMVAERPRKRRRIVNENTQDPGTASDLRRGDDRRVLDPEAIQDLWIEFGALAKAIQAKPGTPEWLSSQDFHEAAKAWAEKFKLKTFEEDVIPYIHALVFHVPQALQRFGYLKDIGIAQVERKNYDQHLVYFQGTSRQGGAHGKMVTKQILERENRLLYYRRHGIGEKKTDRQEERMPQADNSTDEEEESDEEGN